MSNYFSRTFRVRWSEANAYGGVNLAGFLHYTVETAWDWGAANGLSPDESEQMGLAWVIRETEINFSRSLYPDEIFDFTIWLIKWRRVRGTRCFELRLKDRGELIAQGVQQIVTLDGRTLRPTPPPDKLMANFLVKNPRIFPQGKLPNIQLQPKAAFTVQREVEWRDLDTLDHVNNAVYAAYAEDIVAQALASVGWSPTHIKAQGFALHYRRFHIQYLASAVWGDLLDMTASLTTLNVSGGAWFINVDRVSDGEPIIRCALDLVFLDRNTGEEHPLPADLIQVLKKSYPVMEQVDNE